MHTSQISLVAIVEPFLTSLRMVCHRPSIHAHQFKFVHGELHRLTIIFFNNNICLTLVYTVAYSTCRYMLNALPFLQIRIYNIQAVIFFCPYHFSIASLLTHIIFSILSPPFVYSYSASLFLAISRCISTISMYLATYCFLSNSGGTKSLYFPSTFISSGILKSLMDSGTVFMCSNAFQSASYLTFLTIIKGQ